MRKAVRTTLRVGGYTLGGIVALATAGFGYFAYERTSSINDARKLMGPPPGILHVDGLAVRDLNKNGRLDPYEDRRQPIAARVEDLLARMTPEEKAGTLFQSFVFEGKDGHVAGPLQLTNLFPAEVQIFAKKMTFFNLAILDGPENSAHWMNELQHLAERGRLGIPLTISSDPRHSASTTIASFSQTGFSKWPEQIGLAALGDADVVRRYGRIAAQEYRGIGIHVALHPQADLATDPRWGRIAGTFGEDAKLAAKLTTAYIQGYQGDAPSPTSVATVTKHFAGGGPHKDGWDPHFRFGKDQIYPGHNLAYHLIPFRAAIAAHTALIMPYYGVPVGITKENVGFNFNRYIVTDLLRGDLGFKGVVLTDWGLLTPFKILGIDLEPFFPIGGVKDYGVENLSPQDRALKALNAGADQFGGENSPDYILNLVRSGKLSQARVDDSVRRLLALKFQLGLFDNPFVDMSRIRERVGTPEGIALGRAVQRASQVLLTNKPRNGNSVGSPMLPLTAGTRIFVQGLDQKLAARYGTVVDRVEDADVAIVNMPPAFDPDVPNSSLMHQGRLYYTPEQLEPVLDIARKKPTVVTAYLERPFIIPEIAGTARAVLINFGVTDDAVFDVLFGRAAPRGRLPFDMPSTWASVQRQKTDVPFDLDRPLFRFGYGLSYPADNTKTRNDRMVPYQQPRE